MIKINSVISGKYRLVVTDAQNPDVIKKDTGWFSNLITDNGLDLWGRASGGVSEAVLPRFFVGSGSTPPTPSDVSMGSLVAASTGSLSVFGNSSSYADGYCEQSYSYMYPMGAAAGNLSEIGIGVSENNLFSRALIVDALGNPTTLTILSNEFLTVYYTLRCNIPSADQVMVFDAEIDGVPTSTTVIARPANANTNTNEGWQIRNQIGSFFIVYSGDAGLPTGAPSGASMAIPGFEKKPYVLNSLEQEASVEIGINSGNLAGGFIRSIVHRLGPGCWQLQFDPPIAKNNTRSVNFTVGYSWGRA